MRRLDLSKNYPISSDPGATLTCAGILSFFLRHEGVFLEEERLQRPSVMELKSSSASPRKGGILGHAPRIGFLGFPEARRCSRFVVWLPSVLPHWLWN